MSSNLGIRDPGAGSAAQTGQHSGTDTQRLGMWLFWLLAAVYLLSYSGRFHAIDEVSVAAMTENLVKHGMVTTDQIRWSLSWTPSQGQLGADGHLYSKKGIGSALLGAPFYWLSLQVPGTGTVRAMMLANALVTALTGWLLYSCVGKLRYQPLVAAAVALGYGLGTMAWPYAKYFFSEPLTALGLVAGLWGMLSFRHLPRLRYAFVAGLGLGIALLAKVANAVVWPLYLAYALWIAKEQAPKDGQGPRTFGQGAVRLLPAAVSLVLPMLAACLVLALYNHVRAGSLLDLGYAPDETFSTPLWRGLAGLLLSPGKSVFLYSPLLLAGLAGIPALFRRDRATALLSLGVAVAFPLLYAGWFMWWGGWSWGPRFLLPALPFVCLFLAPVMEWSLHPDRRWAMAFLVFLGLASALVQVLGVAVDFNRYLLDLYQQGWDSGQINFRAELSPLLGHWSLLRDSLSEGGAAGLDLAWARDLSTGIDWGKVLWPLGLCLAALFGLWFSHKASDRRGLRLLGLLICITLLAVSMVGLARLPAPADEWQAGGQALSQSLSMAGASGVMIADLLPFGDHLGHTTSLLDRYKAPPISWGWARQEPVSEARQVELAELGQVYRRLWLVLDTTPEADPASTTERWLDEHAFRVSSNWLSPAMRLVQYEWPPGETQYFSKSLDQPLGNDLRLEGFVLVCEGPSGGSLGIRCPSPGIAEARAGDVVPLSLHWRAERPVAEDYAVFVQLLDEGGGLKAQVDRSPVGGFRPTSSWRPGEMITDNYGLALPEELAPGRYRLIAGLYSPASMERLVVITNDGAQQQDHVALGEVLVVGGDGS